jgi:hypothetical protein
LYNQGYAIKLLKDSALLTDISSGKRISLISNRKREDTMNYLLCVLLPTLVISGFTQWYIRSAYSKWRQVPNGRNLTGVDTARFIMGQYGLNVRLEGVPNELGDHFSPNEGVVRLSPAVANQPSVASMAIAAHEFGHVQQYAQRSILITARGFLLPVVQFGSPVATYIMLFGILMNITGLAMVGLILFGATVMFTVLTLPVELDASRRAMKMLDDGNVFTSAEDRRGTRAVLTAAALTYVGAMLIAIMNFAYYAMIIFGGRSRD